MGTILNAICLNCNFQTVFHYGSGMLAFEKECNVPALNLKTGKFVIENYFNKTALKHKVIFYTEREMYQGKKEKSGHQWGNVMINEHKNKCPLCKQFTLDFEFRGLFD